MDIKIFFNNYKGKDKEELITKYDTEDWKRFYSGLNENSKMGKLRVTNLSVKLAIKIEEELNIEVFPIIQRTYAGYWQRSSGAWLWSMSTKSSDVGSGSKATECIKKDKKLGILKFGEIIIEN